MKNAVYIRHDLQFHGNPYPARGGEMDAVDLAKRCQPLLQREQQLNDEEDDEEIRYEYIPNKPNKPNRLNNVPSRDKQPNRRESSIEQINKDQPTKVPNRDTERCDNKFTLKQIIKS